MTPLIIPMYPHLQHFHLLVLAVFSPRHPSSPLDGVLRPQHEAWESARCPMDRGHIHSTFST